MGKTSWIRWETRQWWKHVSPLIVGTPQRDHGFFSFHQQFIIRPIPPKDEIPVKETKQRPLSGERTCNACKRTENRLLKHTAFVTSHMTTHMVEQSVRFLRIHLIRRHASRFTRAKTHSFHSAGTCSHCIDSTGRTSPQRWKKQASCVNNDIQLRHDLSLGNVCHSRGVKIEHFIYWNLTFSSYYIW